MPMVVMTMVVMTPQVVQGMANTAPNTTAKAMQSAEAGAKATVTENPSKFLA
ncbi:MAG: hypothetical protein KC475_08610 [Cyanobacteria bacterium HKST-UBA03]|nr:hypothetical protein [Cyanobacteria bacterium HKST-UBA03]